MKATPIFCGKIHVTAVKNNKWAWYDFVTPAKKDKEILEFTKNICPVPYTVSRQSISQQDGKAFQGIVEQIIGQKLDVPEDSAYSILYSQNHDSKKNKVIYSILLFCQEKRINGDRTAIDIYI